MVLAVHAPIKFQTEWTRPIREKIKKELKDKIWSTWKRVSSKKITVGKNEPINADLLIERGILYWAGGMMKVRRPTGARVSKWIRDNLDVRGDVVYGGIGGDEVRKAQKLKDIAYAGMLDYMQKAGSEQARKVIEDIDINREVDEFITKVRMEIASSVGKIEGIDDELGWRRIKEELTTNIKDGASSSGAFEIERFKTKGVELLESASVQQMENWFGVRYAGSVVERRVDIRVESEAKKAQVDSMAWVLPQGGYGRYIWTTRRDNRVRPDHARLEGRICSWNDPPIVDLRSGRRAHPGGDYNCRCSASPLAD